MIRYPIDRVAIAFTAALLFAATWLGTGTTSGEDVYAPRRDSSHYELGRPRITKDGSGKPILIFSYQRFSSGKTNAKVRLAGNSSSGPLFVDGAPTIEGDSGAVVLDRFIWEIQNGVNLEFYFVESHRLNASTTVKLMVSNSIRIGNPGPPTHPKPLPVSSNPRYEDDVPASMLQGLRARPPRTASNRNSTDQRAPQPAAISKPTIRSFPVAIGVPPGWELVQQGVDIPSGTPLQGCRFRRWHVVTLLNSNPDGTLEVRWTGYGPSFTCKMRREQLIMPTQSSVASSNPAALPSDSLARLVKPLRPKVYKVTIPIPEDSVRVPYDVVLTAGTKLQACYAERWNPITFLSHASNGTLNVHWDDYGSAFDCSVSRDELIIKKSELP